jgi:hypothetical protein
MGFNPLKLLKAAGKVIGGAVGIDIEGAIEALENDPSPDSQAVLAELDVRLKELALEELQTEIDAKVELMVAEIKSEDAFVRRARPTGLYISYLVMTGLAAALVAGVDIDATAILTLVGPLMGYSSWYSHNRSSDKKNAQA